MMAQAAWQDSELPVTESIQAENLCVSDITGGISILNCRLDWKTTEVFFKLKHSMK